MVFPWPRRRGHGIPVAPAGPCWFSQPPLSLLRFWAFADIVCMSKFSARWCTTNSNSATPPCSSTPGTVLEWGPQSTRLLRNARSDPPRLDNSKQKTNHPSNILWSWIVTPSRSRSFTECVVEFKLRLSLRLERASRRFAQ